MATVPSSSPLQPGSSGQDVSPLGGQPLEPISVSAHVSHEVPNEDTVATRSLETVARELRLKNPQPKPVLDALYEVEQAIRRACEIVRKQRKEAH